MVLMLLLLLCLILDLLFIPIRHLNLIDFIGITFIQSATDITDIRADIEGPGKYFNDHFVKKNIHIKQYEYFFKMKLIFFIVDTPYQGGVFR